MIATSPPLAVTGRTRSALAPELPTVSESGLPGFVSTTWFGIYGPRGLPADITARLKRSEFGMTKNIPSVSDEVRLLIGVEAYRDSQ